MIIIIITTTHISMLHKLYTQIVVQVVTKARAKLKNKGYITLQKQKNNTM